LAEGQYSATTIMLPFQVITLSPSEVMKQKRDLILDYYHDARNELAALWMLKDHGTITEDQAYHDAQPLLVKYARCRDWLDHYTLNLLTSEQELKDECELNALEATLGSAE
jgi:hypothetical protein